MNTVNGGPRHAKPMAEQCTETTACPVHPRRADAYGAMMAGCPIRAREPYHGRHRAEDVVNLGKYRRLEKFGLESSERPPSPGYSFTLVEQPGGGA